MFSIIKALDGMEETYPVQSTGVRSVVRRRRDVVNDETGLQLTEARYSYRYTNIDHELSAFKSTPGCI